MRAHFGLPSVESEETEGKPPIHVKFEIPYFTTSGIQVRFYTFKHLCSNPSMCPNVNKWVSFRCVILKLLKKVVIKPCHGFAILHKMETTN